MIIKTHGHLIKSGDIHAKPGQYIICDIFNRPLSIVDHLTSYLGIIYQATEDGNLRRIS